MGQGLSCLVFVSHISSPTRLGSSCLGSTNLENMVPVYLQLFKLLYSHALSKTKSI